ncbi:putative ACR, YggU family [uncultured archaeon]|nr:putative ACR, YggU family [uncultured archaeon]
MFYKVFVSFHKDFIEINGDQIEIGVMAKPLKGDANSEIIEKISKKFRTSKSKVRIVSGKKSRNKVIEITI